MGGAPAPADVTSQDYKYNGKELDKSFGLNWYFYGARMYDPAVGRFTGVDPIADQFAFVSVYNYAENTPINAIDLHGLQAFFVHGTGGSPAAWEDVNLVNSIVRKMDNSVAHTDFEWNGNNNSADRYLAALDLVQRIKADRKPGEPITIVGHSHGGSIGILAVNILRKNAEFHDSEINLVTLNTVFRDDYILNENPEDNELTNHYNLYVPNDVVVQHNAGYDLTGIISHLGWGPTKGKPGKPPRGTIHRKLLGLLMGEEFYRSVPGQLMGGEAGSGGLTHPGATNIEVSSVKNLRSFLGGLGRTLNAKINHRLWWSKHGQSQKATEAINNIER